jgi:hypothetical protein
MEAEYISGGLGQGQEAMKQIQKRVLWDMDRKYVQASEASAVMEAAEGASAEYVKAIMTTFLQWPQQA